MSYTTDPNDPELGRGVDIEPVSQHAKYLILSEEERAKGFIRPVREAYIHVGQGYKDSELRDVSDGNKNDPNLKKYAKVLYHVKNKDTGEFIGGRFITQKEVDQFIKTGRIGGCGSETKMGLALCETYARDPSFYGSTYCCHCQKHLPVGEFIWKEDNETVGS
jgi:hypothetical protein